MTLALSSNQSAIVVRNLTTSNNVALPSAPTAGNKLIYIVAVDKSAGTFTPPSGFTQRANYVAASVSLHVAEKTSDGSETGNITATWTTNRASKAFVAEITATGTIAFDVAAQNGTETAGQSLNTGSANAGANAVLAIVVWCCDSAKANPADPDPTGSWTGSYSTQVQNWQATAGWGEPGFVIGVGTPTPSAANSSTYTHDGTTDQMAAAIIIFSETGGGGGPSGHGALLAQHRNRRVFA